MASKTTVKAQVVSVAATEIDVIVRDNFDIEVRSIILCNRDTVNPVDITIAIQLDSGVIQNKEIIFSDEILPRETKTIEFDERELILISNDRIKVLADTNMATITITGTEL